MCIRDSRYLGLLKEAFKTVLGFDVDITLVVPSLSLIHI